VFDNWHGILVRDDYAGWHQFDATLAGVQQCGAHYPEPTIMPTSGAPALVGAGVVGGQLGIITGLRGRRSADRGL
jgi:hypothetical protein